MQIVREIFDAYLLIEPRAEFFVPLSKKVRSKIEKHFLALP